MFVGFVVLASLQIFPLVSFLLLSALLVFGVRAIAVAQELIWGARVSVLVSRQPARAGESFRAMWAFGRQDRFTGVRVSWRGREEAILRGYDSTTFSEPFLTERLDPSGGQALIDVMPDAMPTFTARHCRIVWSILIETRRDDGWTAEDFPIVILPSR